VSKESRRAARNAARAHGTTPASTGPTGTARAGRRERVRRIEQRSFLERYRNLLLAGVVIAVAAVVVGIVFVGATQPAYACTIEWEPTPTASPSPDASNRLGYAQDDMGNSHAVRKPQRYTFCPPASGTHLNAAGIGPITPVTRVFRPDDSVGPTNWIHNLEHGALVVLYRGDSEGATDAGQQRFKEFFDSFPPSPICQVPPHKLSPIIARFDQMKWLYAALVWDRVLPMPEWDPQLALQFYATESERRDADGAYVAPPEPQAECPRPSASAEPVPSGTTSPSPTVSPSPATSESAAPSGSSPGASPSPAPS
jgi:hypothetical protein